MNGDQIQELLYTVTRFGVVVFMVFYASASLVVWKQVSDMHKQVTTNTGRLLVLFTLINVIVSMVLFVLAVFFGFIR